MDDELKDREFNRKIDTYLETATMTASDYESCTPMQKSVIQVIKRAFARHKVDEPII